MFKVTNKDIKKRKYGALMFFLHCFSFFIVKFEHVNVCLDKCCVAKSFKTYLKNFAKMNTFGWCQNRYLLRIKIATPTGSQNRGF